MLGKRAMPSRRLLALLMCVFASAFSGLVFADFGNYLPLSLSGSLDYGYGYVNSGGTESESTSLTGTINADGYIWKPWFTTTSAALNLGLSNSQTSSSSSDAKVVSGMFSLNLFPLSRFPFSLSYSQTDSRTDSYSDLTQVSGGANHRSTRLSLRQSYRARQGTLTNLWFYKTRFEAEGIDSTGENYGAMVQENKVSNSFTLSLNHSVNETSTTDLKPTTDVLSVTHSYTPSGELGVSNILSYVDSESGSNTVTQSSKLSQVASSFFWRPEHRAFSINGGVRLAEIKGESDIDSTQQRSMNTNIGATYRLTRTIHMGASASVGSSESDGVQSVTTNQATNISFSSNRYLIAGFDYSWQASANASNSSVTTDDINGRNTTDSQNVGAGLGHTGSKNWHLGQFSSLGLGLSQSVAGSKSSEDNDLTESLNHGASVSWSHRGKGGSTYGNLNVADSRTQSRLDSNFQQLSLSLSHDLSINQLSNLNGSVSYQASRQEQELDTGGSSSILIRSANGNLAYQHERPFGVYNLRFTSRLLGSKQIGSTTQSTQVDWDNRFSYSLGLLDTSLSFRIIETSGGARTSSLYFRATRSF